MAQEGRPFAFLRGPLLGVSMLGSQRGAQLLPPRHLLLFNMSIHSPERNTPAVMISVKNANTSLRLVVVFHRKVFELRKTLAPFVVG